MSSRLYDSNDCGKLIIIIGSLMAIPLLVIPFYPEDMKYALSFLIPSLGSIILGFGLCHFFPQSNEVKSRQLTFRRGCMIVLFTWLYGFLMGAMPFIIAGKLGFVEALFEAVSGWTTTGLSVISVDVAPQIFIFHRGFMQYCGGLGFVMVMIIFLHGKQLMNLYSAEGHPDKLTPNLGKTARIILLMYTTFLIIGVIAYMIFGMNAFDSIIHAMCALSTGGFSTKMDSIGAYNNIGIEAITIVLMLIGTTNFAVLLLLSKRKIKQFFKVSEVRFLLWIIAIVTPLIAFSLVYSLNTSISQGMRVSLFNVVSALSTSGFSTMSFTKWTPFANGIMIILMLIGGGIGSTAGGIKLTRVHLTLKVAKENLRKRMNPSRNISKPFINKAQGKQFIDSNMIEDTISFIFFYLAIFITGSLLITLSANCSLMEAMFDFSSSLGTVGLSIGITGPGTDAITLIIEMIGMILGRLEIFIVFIAIYSGIVRIKDKVTNKK